MAWKEILVISSAIISASLGQANKAVGHFEYKYSLQRDDLIQKEKAFSRCCPELSKDEEIVKNYLTYLKWKEFNATRDYFYPAKPIENVVDKIKQSKVYSVLKRLPKGGNMHLHQNHILSVSKMLDFILSSNQKDNLYVKTREPDTWALDFYVAPPDGWVQVTSDPVTYSKENLLQHLIMLNVLDKFAEENPTDSMKRWELLSPLFGLAGSQLVKNANFTPVYIEAVFEAAFNENVQYLEARAHGDGLYILDPAPEYNITHGKHYIDNPDGELWVETVQKVLNEFRAKHPEFIGYREIIAGSRSGNPAYVERTIETTERLQKKFPDVVRGFDLVGEEDRGYSLLFFIDEFADIEMAGEKVPLYFHTAETNWPDDIITSRHANDPVGTEQNVYEAVLLGAKRVGHGIGFIHHPYLLEVMKTKGIAIEANPVSNMLLGYVTDQRHHPAITYHRYGIPVVLGSDDPGRFGYDEFSVDWYEAFMGWGIDLADLKQFANNSLQYSTMTTSQRQTAFSKWSTAWTKFINDTKQEACKVNLSEDTPEIHRIYPMEGFANNETKIRVFGRYFESGICQNIICRFGTLSSKAKYVYNSMITCSAPAAKDNLGTLTFSLSFDGGIKFIQTNKTFSYLHTPQSSDAEVIMPPTLKRLKGILLWACLCVCLCVL